MIIASPMLLVWRLRRLSLGVGRLLWALAGSQIEVDGPDSSVRVKLY
jgi:hypothetical protein